VIGGFHIRYSYRIASHFTAVVIDLHKSPDVGPTYIIVNIRIIVLFFITSRLDDSDIMFIALTSIISIPTPPNSDVIC